MQSGIWKDSIYPYQVKPSPTYDTTIPVGKRHGNYITLKGWLVPSDRGGDNGQNPAETMAVLDTTNKGVTLAYSSSSIVNGGLVYDLGVDLGTAWACKFQFRLDSLLGNDYYFINLTTEDKAPWASTQESISVQAQGSSYDRFTLNKNDNGTQTEDATSNSAWSVNTTYYCTLIRSGDTVSLKIMTGSYSGSVVDTLTRDISGFTGSLRYLQHSTRGNTNGSYCTGWIRDVHFANGETTI